MKQGWTIWGNAEALVLISPDGKQGEKFNIKILTPNCMLFAIYMKRTHDEAAGITTTNGGLAKQLTMSVQQAHERLGHINETMMKEIAKSLGWKLTSSKKLNYATCAEGKAKQKSLKKVNVPDPNDEANGYRAYLDISTVEENSKYPVPSNLNQHLIVVGTKLQLKFSLFFKMKNVMVEPTCELLYQRINAGKNVSKLRMDNASENKKRNQG